MNISTIEGGKLHNILNSEQCIERNWNSHPKFEGVYLKHLITGAQTNNLFSSHIVKILPHCILDTHAHEGKTELHEVYEGNGTCIIGSNEFTCNPGDNSIIPSGTEHKVIASETGMLILAKFFPALL